MELPHYGVMRPNMGYYHQPTTPQPSPSPINVPSPVSNIMPPPQQQLSPVTPGMTGNMTNMGTNMNVPFRGNHPGLFLPRGPVGNMGGSGGGYFQSAGGGPSGVYSGGYHPSPMPYQQQLPPQQSPGMPQQQQQQQQQLGYMARQQLPQPGFNQSLQQSQMSHFTHPATLHQQPYHSPTMQHSLPPPPPHPAAMLPPPTIPQHQHQHHQQHLHQAHSQHSSVESYLDSPSANRDPVTKAKALAAAVRKSLERLFELANKNLKHNVIVDAGEASGDTVAAVSAQAFEVALEEFVLVCNRLELQLQILLELRKTANTVYRYAPLPVTTKSDMVSPQEDGALSYNQYLTVTRSQVDIIKHLRSTLFSPQPSFPPLDIFPGRF